MNLELFPPEPRQNLLPYEGIVQDYGLILSAEDSHAYLQQCLQQLAWQADEVTLFGKHYVTARKIAWYGDEYYQYRYSGSLKQAQRWHPALWQLKQQIEQMNAMIGGGMTAEQASEVMNIQITGEVENLGKDQAQNFFYTYIMIFALYMVILLYGQMVATNVATEKSSRAMEVLITSAKPKQNEENINHNF